jgi:hypothetical protein
VVVVVDSSVTLGGVIGIILVVFSVIVGGVPGFTLTLGGVPGLTDGGVPGFMVTDGGVPGSTVVVFSVILGGDIGAVVVVVVFSETLGAAGAVVVVVSELEDSEDISDQATLLTPTKAATAPAVNIDT